MQRFITLEQASDNAHNSYCYDFFRSSSFMIASVADEFINRGYGQWRVKEINHESGETDIELTIIDPKANEEHRIGMHYYPEGVVHDEDKCHYFWYDDIDDIDDTDDK